MALLVIPGLEPRTRRRSQVSPLRSALTMRLRRRGPWMGRHSEATRSTTVILQFVCRSLVGPIFIAGILEVIYRSLRWNTNKFRPEHTGLHSPRVDGNYQDRPRDPLGPSKRRRIGADEYAPIRGREVCEPGNEVVNLQDCQNLVRAEGDAHSSLTYPCGRW